MLLIPHAALYFHRGGVTALKSDEKLMQTKWILSCLKRLMIPYFIWTIFYCLIDRRFDFLNALFFEPILWYLIHLFICDLILFVSVHTRKMKLVTMAVIYVLFFIFYGLFRDGNLVIKNIAMYFPFYFAGYIIFCSKDKIWAKRLKKYLWVGAVLYPASMILYTYKQYDLVIAKVQGILGITSHGGLIHIVVLFYNHAVVATLGIIFIWFIVELLLRLSPLRKFLAVIARLGQYTMFTYLLESVTSHIITGNFMNNIVLSGIVLVVLRMSFPLAIAYILSFVPKLRLVLFGQ